MTRGKGAPIININILWILDIPMSNSIPTNFLLNPLENRTPTKTLITEIPFCRLPIWIEFLLISHQESRLQPLLRVHWRHYCSQPPLRSTGQLPRARLTAHPLYSHAHRRSKWHSACGRSGAGAVNTVQPPDPHLKARTLRYAFGGKTM